MKTNMETIFQTENATRIQPQEEGFLTGLRHFRLTAVATILILIGTFEAIFYGFVNIIGLSFYEAQLLFLTTTAVVANAVYIFLPSHVLSGKRSKVFGIISLVVIGLHLFAYLSLNVWNFHVCSTNTTFDYYTNMVLIGIYNFLTSLFFILLSIGCNKRYRLGLIILAIAPFISDIYLFFFRSEGSIAWNIFANAFLSVLSTIGYAHLLYQGLKLPGKKIPQNLALKLAPMQGNIAYKICNITAASFLLIYIIFALFFKPEQENLDQLFMPAGCILLELCNLALIASIFALSFTLNTVATKTTGFIMSSLLLIIHYALDAVFCYEAAESYRIFALNMANILTFIVYFFMATIMFWLIKKNTVGEVRTAMALSVSSMIAAMSLIPVFFALNNINYHSYDNYYTAVIIIICIFIIAPWLMLHLIKQSFPKMRMAFLAIPLGIILLGFLVLRLNMNGSWNHSSSYDYYSMVTTCNNNAPTDCSKG